MTRPALTFLTLLASLATVAPAQAQWSLVWSDEFNFPGRLNPGRWTFDIGGSGWGNNELQFYTDRTENVRCEQFPTRNRRGPRNGRLIIEARREPYQGRNYTSARIKSRFAMTYGRVIFSAKLPEGRGLWPALWMLPVNTTHSPNYWPDNGEMDIMEQVGFDPFRIHGTMHTKAFNHLIGNPPTNSIINTAATTGFQIYTLEWRPDKVQVFTGTENNPAQTHILTWNREGRGWEAYPFNHDFFAILNIAVGGNWGGLQGVDDSIFPRRMEVDYVRFFKMVTTPFSSSVPTLPGRIEAENFDEGGEGFAYHDTTPANQGGAFRNTGVDLEIVNDGYISPSVGWLDTDEWLTYTVNLAATQDYGFTFRVASTQSNRSFYVEVDDKRVTPDLIVPNTGDWHTFQSISWNKVRLTAGQHKIRIVSNSNLFNLNWFDVWKAQ